MSCARRLQFSISAPSPWTATSTSRIRSGEWLSGCVTWINYPIHMRCQTNCPCREGSPIDSLMSGHCRCFVCTLLIRRVVMPVTFLWHHCLPLHSSLRLFPLIVCHSTATCLWQWGSLIAAHNCFISNRFMAHYEPFFFATTTGDCRLATSSSSWLSTFGSQQLNAVVLWLEPSSVESLSVVRAGKSFQRSVITSW